MSHSSLPRPSGVKSDAYPPSNPRSPEYTSTYASSTGLSSSGDHPPPLNLDSVSERVIELSPNNRYAKLNHLLGTGAFKVVHKAIDREEGIEVAWNACPTTKAEFNELSEEIEILKMVRHPNIIQFYDCWYNNTEFVFVTELMTSGTLREYIRRLSIPNVRVVKRWCRQILRGLQYLHSHNPPIIHRDIKCDNIFINGSHGEVKIGDMGTAKMKWGKKYTVIGTPEFMAPEMYDEAGYNESVDIYAFGMALLEMVTGEYPYQECTNPAQIFKKVTQGVKPNCLSRVREKEVLDLINQCIGDEKDRPTAQQILEHPFMAIEPEVLLLEANETKTQLSMQVVFKDMDKLSRLKFEFNAETDTAEQVVSEMIHEQVLSSRYQHLITTEINRILKELQRPMLEDDRHREESRLNRRSASARSQGERDDDMQRTRSDSRPPASYLPDVIPMQREGSRPSSTSSEHSTLTRKPSQNEMDNEMYEQIARKEYADDVLVSELVKDTAEGAGRGVEKGNEWLQRLHNQDIMTIGDLRQLTDPDWDNLGLTVFAARALKNALTGKPSRQNSAAAKPLVRSSSSNGVALSNAAVVPARTDSGSQNPLS
ncbi:kinase-like domain-containing protein [Polychytrium aggregatum]|uniref:kinase-like domain-containing protein n=1 Tax=Polychytrium aggregatum TaxID=110093 RepID=UPI0022FEB686|nr:kinase-like domain-containing protein [Polychytrium aggregatum]KAI9205115.1 kinase-like domain-containing protein [Polychytrium aggregatum]